MSKEITVSKETITHLNTNTLIGMTDQRGHAWHYRAEEQGEESNHYPGAIPLEDVQRRLFHWTAESRSLAVEVPSDVETMTHLGQDGAPVRWVAVEDRQAICRSDDDTVMGIFKSGYRRHQYADWLLGTVAAILDDNLAISSAGLLRGGAIAWVEVSVPETISTPQGVNFRPNLLATTSFDGSTATTYKRTFTATVCDNTRDLALSEPGHAYKLKHTRHSTARIGDARQALSIVYTMADAFAQEVVQLCATPVTPSQWGRFLDLLVPRADADGQPLEGRALTQATSERDRLDQMWLADPRVAPWTGTAHGVLQAVNTYEHHEGVVRGTPRAERNMLRTISGDFSDLDRSTWRTLTTVLA